MCLSVYNCTLVTCFTNIPVTLAPFFSIVARIFASACFAFVSNSRAISSEPPVACASICWYCCSRWFLYDWISASASSLACLILAVFSTRRRRRRVRVSIFFHHLSLCLMRTRKEKQKRKARARAARERKNKPERTRKKTNQHQPCLAAVTIAFASCSASKSFWMPSCFCESICSFFLLSSFFLLRLSFLFISLSLSLFKTTTLRNDASEFLSLRAPFVVAACSLILPLPNALCLLRASSGKRKNDVWRKTRREEEEEEFSRLFPFQQQSKRRKTSKFWQGWGFFEASSGFRECRETEREKLKGSLAAFFFCFLVVRAKETFITWGCKTH